MKQLMTNVACSKDYFKEKEFYFNVDEDGNPLPNYCEDFSNSPECHNCAFVALKKLVEKTKESILS